MTARRRLVLLSLVLAPAFALSCGGGGGVAEPPGADAEGAPAGQDTTTAESAPPESTLEPLPRDEVELYYPSAAGDGLAGEFHEIFSTATPGDRVKQIVADLIGGPTSAEAIRAVPAGTRLRQAWVLDNGVAFLDFSSELADGLGGGSMNELLTVYAIIDSVVANVAEIDRVGILINGRPVDTLNGHLDLRRPLGPDWSLVLGPVTVEAPGRGDAPAVAGPAAPPAGPGVGPGVAPEAGRDG